MKSAQLAKQDAELAAAKQESVTRLAADKKEQAALQKAHHATLKASIHFAETYSIPTCSQLDPHMQKITLLQQELSQAQQAKHEASKVKLVFGLHNDNTLHITPGLCYCSHLPSIEMYVVPICVHFISALSEEVCCMSLQADPHLSFVVLCRRLRSIQTSCRCSLTRGSPKWDLFSTS